MVAVHSENDPSRHAPRTGYYPVSLDVRGRRAVVIGDMPLIVDGKVDGLLEHGARVLAITAEPSAHLTALAEAGRIELRARGFEPDDLGGAFLAIVSLSDRAQHEAVWREAELQRVLLNAVDDQARCHFIAPAIHREGPITIAVSTAGTSPALAVRLRDAIARVVRPEHGRLAAMLGEMRELVASMLPDGARRTRAWYRVVDSDVLELLRRGEDRIARARVVELVSGEAADAPPTDSPRRPGPVYIVGAGPGRASLITVAGLRALRRADAVVYDRLVHPALVRAAPVEARRVFVGKLPGSEAGAQAAINDLLISLASAGHTVVRLKGGDPFVFGRGSEECAALRKAGIRHRVIPGVTSAIAAAAAAGIPVTMRRHASAFAVVTGHRASGEPPPDWDALARIPTVVALMAFASLGEIVCQLLKRGRAADTPVAVIASATLPEQRVITGTLTTIVGRVRASGLEPPATVVIGDVVRERWAARRAARQTD